MKPHPEVLRRVCKDRHTQTHTVVYYAQRYPSIQRREASSWAGSDGWEPLSEVGELLLRARWLGLQTPCSGWPGISPDALFVCTAHPKDPSGRLTGVLLGGRVGGGQRILQL